jgi:hypothetical protein
MNWVGLSNSKWIYYGLVVTSMTRRRLIGSSPHLQIFRWKLRSECPKWLVNEIHRTKRLIHFLQCLLLLCGLWIQGCSQLGRSRLRERYSEGDIERIDDQFCRLRLTVREEIGLKRILQHIQAGSDQSTFQDCWSPREFDDLETIAGASSLFRPGRLAWNQTFRSSTGRSTQTRRDFSLEAILHCKQIGRMRKLFEE